MCSNSQIYNNLDSQGLQNSSSFCAPQHESNLLVHIKLNSATKTASQVSKKRSYEVASHSWEQKQANAQPLFRVTKVRKVNNSNANRCLQAPVKNEGVADQVGSSNVERNEGSGEERRNGVID